jgi:lysophospholipase L1-like esterase
MMILRRTILPGYLALPGYLTLLCPLLTGACLSQSATATLKFDFSGGPGKPGYTRVSPALVYTDEIGYGYEPSAQVALGDNGKTTTSERPFTFSAKVPEGNYTVTLTFGDSSKATTTTVKAESGRLMLERVQVGTGEVAERSFTTNVRTPKLAKLPTNATGREEVSLDQFDRGNTRDWDDKLNIEIVSPHAALRTIEISAAPSAPTVFLAGDSTVTDRDGGGDVSWGQLLPRFLRPGVAVSNQAQSGETLKSFANALRLDKILSQMKQGDYLFLQFGHNDSKETWPQTYVEAETTYKAYLKAYIAEAKLRGAIPVLVTPMDRANRTTGAPSHGHGGYPDAMREVAKEEQVPLIDLYKMSILFYDSAGGDAPKILADGTHSTAYGGYEFAKCIVMGIRQKKLKLADDVVADFKDFDPAHPDSAAELALEQLFSGNEKRTTSGGRNGNDPGKAGSGSSAEKPGLGPP